MPDFRKVIFPYVDAKIVNHEVTSERFHYMFLQRKDFRISSWCFFAFPKFGLLICSAVLIMTDGRRNIVTYLLMLIQSKKGSSIKNMVREAKSKDILTRRISLVMRTNEV